MGSRPVTRLYDSTRPRPWSLDAALPVVSAELVSQRVFECREGEGEPYILQAGRARQLARQEQFVSQFSRGKPQRRGWCPQNSRPAKNAAEHLCEGMVGDGVRSDRIDGTDQAVVANRLEEDAEQVVEGDPAHELLAAAEWSPEPEPKRRDHPGEETAAPSKNDPKARQDDPNAGCRGWRSPLLPGAAHVGKEAGARRRFLRQRGVPSIAVVPDA